MHRGSPALHSMRIGALNGITGLRVLERIQGSVCGTFLFLACIGLDLCLVSRREFQRKCLVKPYYTRNVSITLVFLHLTVERLSRGKGKAASGNEAGSVGGDKQRVVLDTLTIHEALPKAQVPVLECFAVSRIIFHGFFRWTNAVI